MNHVAILFGLLLIGLGAYGYLGQSSPRVQVPVTGAVAADSPDSSHSPKASPTALIPAGFGILMLICGILGQKPSWRKHALHFAAGVAALGVVLGGGRFLSKVGDVVNGDPGVNQRAVLFTGVLALICLLYVVLSLQSFIAARRSRLTKAD